MKLPEINYEVIWRIFEFSLETENFAEINSKFQTKAVLRSEGHYAKYLVPPTR